MNRILLASLLIVLSCATAFAVDKRRVDVADLVGDWSGTSLCQVKPSPCHDEQVVFRLSHPQKGTITVQADKIVDGKPVTMGVGDWSYDPVSQALSWEIPRGTWKLVVDGDDMSGTLITRDNVVFRKVHLRRSK